MIPAAVMNIAAAVTVMTAVAMNFMREKVMPSLSAQGHKNPNKHPQHVISSVLTEKLKHKPPKLTFHSYIQMDNICPPFI